MARIQRSRCSGIPSFIPTSEFDAVDGSSNDDLTSAFGTSRKCHWRLATSAFGRLTDIGSVVRDFR